MKFNNMLRATLAAILPTPASDIYYLVERRAIYGGIRAHFWGRG